MVRSFPPFRGGQQQLDGPPLATKPFFKIGEVAKLLGVKPHVLRYWESEFPSLKPRKNPSGQRLYAKADIEALQEIKNLLYTDCYTISGARQLLAYQRSSAHNDTCKGTSGILHETGNGLPDRQGGDASDGFAAGVSASSDLRAALALLKKNIHEMMALLQKKHPI